MAMVKLSGALLLVILALAGQAAAQTMPDQLWLQGVAEEAAAAGISSEIIQQALGRAQLNDRVVALDQKQPEKTISFATYLKNTVTPQRIETGRRLLRENAALLNDIADQYGVPPQVIVALWGMESSYGRNTGNFDVISALVTLAYEGRRAAFFRTQLIAALRILDRERFLNGTLVGSWAGAMGQSQFIPTTYLNYAVDYDGDGRRDIWSTNADIFASIAHYLASEGWSHDLTWGREVTLTRPISADLVGLDKRRLLAAWSLIGIRSKNGHSLPNRKLEASLVQPDGPGGRSFLVYDNYRALMRWNRSTYFATAVGLLADSLRL